MTSGCVTVHDRLTGEEKGVFWQKLVPADGGDKSGSAFSLLMLVKQPSSLQAVVLLWWV